MENINNIFTEDIEIASHGKVYLTIENDDGTKAIMAVRNKVVRSGREALARSLANQFDGTYSFYAVRVLFGTNGTLGGAPRFVDDTRTGLFGTVALAKPVIASIDPDFPTQVTFTTVVAKTELVGQTINEMALEMANGDIFSMTTFGDVTKNSSMQLTWNWRLTWV